MTCQYNTSFFKEKMEMPIALILMKNMEDLEVLEDFAGRNELDVVGVEVGGYVGFSYYREDDMLDSLSLLEHLRLACTLYRIAEPVIPCPPHPSPSISDCSVKSVEDQDL